MKWLNDVADEAVSKHPDGEIIVSSGVSPSGKYHLGTLREVMTAEVIARELRRRGRDARHVHFVDDLDALRKIPAGLPSDFTSHLGKPLCQVPAPSDGAESYADYFLKDLLSAADILKLQMDIQRSHVRYREGFFAPAIELALDSISEVRRVLETVSGHKLGEEWSPVQVNEEGYLKKREFLAIDKNNKTITYKDKDGAEKSISYAGGEVKLDWRIDWPARWWLLGVRVEPFGRDHATKGGSYDTGAALMSSVFKALPPQPVPYAFINRSGETKKMSKSSGETVNLSELLQILPPEVVWFFIIRYSPDKQLFFDEADGVVRLIDDFAELLAKPGKTPEEQQLLDLCTHGLEQTVSSVPFSHLVASYQAALKDPAKTIAIIARTEHGVHMNEGLVKKELAYIDGWLEKWAPEEMKFELKDNVEPSAFSDQDREFLDELAQKVTLAPKDADGEYFHKAIYEFKESHGLQPQELFKVLYQALIGKDSGPRAGWFLSILPRDWLIKRLRLEA